ncbi:MAG: hypothetical protein R2878_05945 [Thermoleophilia bacterium]
MSTAPNPKPTDEVGDILRQAQELAQHVRDAEERAQALRTLRDRAIITLLEQGMSTRKVGAHLGLTATQVSTIWRRVRPARASGRRPRQAKSG